MYFKSWQYLQGSPQAFRIVPANGRYELYQVMRVVVVAEFTYPELLVRDDDESYTTTQRCSNSDPANPASFARSMLKAAGPESTGGCVHGT